MKRRIKYRNTTDPYFLMGDDQPGVSLAMLDPLIALDVSIAAQAIIDLHNVEDLSLAADALVWLADPDAYDFFAELGYNVEPGELTFLAAKGKMRVGVRW